METSEIQIDNLAYQQGIRSALEDFRLIRPHATRKPNQSTAHKTQSWFLGRAHGFLQAEKLLKPNQQS